MVDIKNYLQNNVPCKHASYKYTIIYTHIFPHSSATVKSCVLAGNRAIKKAQLTPKKLKKIFIPKKLTLEETLSN